MGEFKKCHTTMLLAKCCHDMDLMMWLMSETKPTKISSFGGKYQFKPENAPENAGTICMKDCPLVDSCVYSTKDFILTIRTDGHFMYGMHLRVLKIQRLRTKSI